jgi:hypothetical protein
VVPVLHHRDGGGEWNVDLTATRRKSTTVRTKRQLHRDDDREDFMGIIDGSLNAQMAFLQAK